jgi:hypothetical protein
MADRPVHMVRATVCGRARRGDSFTADWRHVRCPECEPRRPVPRSACLHCHRVIVGNCMHLARFGAWLHVECTSPFERSALGRHLLGAFRDLYRPLTCSGCGRPGPDHGPACKLR